uniref:Secreted protein n=1 Tax=Echinococcus granulosus TaxID=6210 RepID=A0A068WVM6_ECHGR|nr:hypothetical protein EgrG_000125300 [Echinococcus granulosus]
MTDHVGWSITSYPKCNASTVCLILSFSSEPLSGSTISPSPGGLAFGPDQWPHKPFCASTMDILPNYCVFFDFGGVSEWCTQPIHKEAHFRNSTERQQKNTFY